MVDNHPVSSNRFTVLLPTEQEASGIGDCPRAEWNQTLTRLLEPQGVHTILAHSGREALDYIENTRIHAVVLDTHMPQLGGLQVIRLMREMHKAPPAILLTSHLTNHLLREALTMHVFSVLPKPVDFNLLLDALARVLRRYHENRWPDGNVSAS